LNKFEDKSVVQHLVTTSWRRGAPRYKQWLLVETNWHADAIC